MAKQRKLRTPLRWTWCAGDTPVWPREPDIDTVRALARQHLQAEIPVKIKHDLLDVSFFAEGGFNKLYQITYAEHETPYLLRITLPVDPYLKTESEVATIAFLRAHTSVPVPRVVAWQSNRDNELDFEWILMEKIPGVPLCDVWRKVPWNRKLSLTDVLAGFTKEIQGHQFDEIGALYFRSAFEKVAEERVLAMTKDATTGEETIGLESLEQSEKVHSSKTSMATDFQFVQLCSSPDGAAQSKQITHETEEQLQCQPALTTNRSKDDWAIGQLHDGVFIIRNRIYIPSDRGPYPDPIRWLRGLIHLQMEWIKKGNTESDDEYPDDFREEASAMMSLCHEYLEILPKLFSVEEERQSYVLNHSDLNLANILVDPETFDITAIVDWEMVNIVPLWRATEYPLFMQDIEPMDEQEPPIPSYEDEEDIAVYIRDRWDNRLMRHRWEDAMKRLRGAITGTKTPEEGHEIRLKREFLAQIPNLTDRWTSAQHWVKEFKLGKESSSDTLRL